MNILILTESYPEPNNLYNYAFVHTRAKAYQNYNHNVLVLYLNNRENKDYTHEGIRVLKGNYNYWKGEIKNFYPNIIATHSPKNLIFNSIDILQNDFKIKNVTWIHGIEALNICRRFYDVDSLKSFIRFITIEQLRNVKKLYLMRKYINDENSKNNVFVFVSNWMYKIAKQDTFSIIANVNIISNPIDTNTFEFISNRNPHKFLIIRSFDSKKYANDISIEILNKLYQKGFNYEVSIFGEGKYFDFLTNQIKNPNKKIYKKNLTHKEMKKEFSDFGFFLCPTRQDAQGVTMCEAMSAGLVPITSHNTAIPEFVQNDFNGIVDNNIDFIVEKIISVVKNNDFSNISQNASKSMQKLSFENIIESELELLSKTMRGK